MYAVTGSWQVDTALDAEQLAHIPETVRHHGGFVRGYWGQEPNDTTLAHAFVVFDDLTAAEAMAQGVRAAIPSANLSILRILASAE
ncbi:MAG TPA: hypothetical protein VLL08_14095 [Kineosporiaceae bacterium]|nr:hypothetical protein [Kineosporiaceae bacterium]